MGTHRQYDRSFKERAGELGITAERIYMWRREFADHGDASFQGHGVERLSDEGNQLKETQKKLRNAEIELEILKKAIAVFPRSTGNVCVHRHQSGTLPSRDDGARTAHQPSLVF